MKPIPNLRPPGDESDDKLDVLPFEAYFDPFLDL